LHNSKKLPDFGTGTTTILAPLSRTRIIIPVAGKQDYGEQKYPTYFVEALHHDSAIKIKLF
jgi:hypothetical protein